MSEGQKVRAGSVRHQTSRPRQWSDVIAAPRPAASAAQGADINSASRSQKAIDITFRLPKVSISPLVKLGRNIWQRFMQLPRRTRTMSTIAGAVMIIALGAYAFYAFTPHWQQTVIKTPSGLAHGSPSYPTVLPSGKNIASLGGWSRVSPPNRNPVYAFADKIASVPVAVSEQPLPSEFLTDTSSKVSQLATDYNASQKVTFGNKDVFYIGTASNGQQSVILTKNNLLILIKSDSKIDTNSWVQYISALQ